MFTCSSCGQEHDLDELSFGADAPAQWDILRPEERVKSFLGSDLCVIESEEGKSRYLRGCLEIPIRGTSRPYAWGVWVSLSEKSFEEVEGTWDDPERVKRGPYFGWLCTPIPDYPDTMYLKTQVHQRPPGTRPFIELEPTGHPLAVHQRDGIQEEDLRARLVKLLHPE